MSYLYRTGNGRNNIAFTNTANSSTRYLRRTSTGRNNIVWTTIPQGSTYNILQRNGTGRNNILWSNLNIPSPGNYNLTSDIPGNDYIQSGAQILISIDFPYCNFTSSSTYNRREIQGTSSTGCYNGMNPKKFSGRLVKASNGFSGEVIVLMHGVSSTSNIANIIAYAKKCTIYYSNDIWITFRLNGEWSESFSKLIGKWTEYNTSDETAVEDFCASSSNVGYDNGAMFQVVFNTIW